MSEKMYPIPFASLMNWIVTEYAQSGDIFGVHKKYEATGKSLPIFGERIETPFGPAAGPNSQLAQNIIAAYFAGALLRGQDRTEDGRRRACRLRAPPLHPRRRRGLQSGVVHRADRGAGAGRVHQGVVRAQGHQQGLRSRRSRRVRVQYVRRLRPRGHQGPQGQQLHRQHDGREQDRAVQGMQEGAHRAVPRRARFHRAHLLARFPLRHRLHAPRLPAAGDRAHRKLSAHRRSTCTPSSSATPPSSATRPPAAFSTPWATTTSCSTSITSTRISSGRTRCPCSRRLQKLADKEGLEFGLKLSNTFPVDTTRGELPNDEMYMSGRSLFPLTIEMCNRISRAFGGKDAYLASPAARNTSTAISSLPRASGPSPSPPPFSSRAATTACSRWSRRSSRWSTAPSPAPTPPPSPTSPPPPARITITSSPSSPAQPQVHRAGALARLLHRPCKGGCPIEQDIPSTSSCAARVSTAPRSSSSPRRTPCRSSPAPSARTAARASAPRNFYEESVHIRDTKLLAAQKGYNALMASIKLPERVEGKRVAIIGGGPTGIAAAYFCGRPRSRPPSSSVSASSAACRATSFPPSAFPTRPSTKDIALMLRYGVEVKVRQRALPPSRS